MNPELLQPLGDAIIKGNTLELMSNSGCVQTPACKSITILQTWESDACQPEQSVGSVLFAVTVSPYCVERISER